MSADRLAEIKARADAATKGPWHWREGEPTSLVHVTSPRMHPWNILKAPDWGPTLADAEFIAAAREDVPWLVERVERLERWKAEALGIIDYRGEQQQRAEDERDNALAEVARLTTEREWSEDRFPCDGGCVDAPEETCSRHGRSPADLWRIIGEVAAERDTAIERLERVIDQWRKTGRAVISEMNRADKAEAERDALAAQVARVEALAEEWEREAEDLLRNCYSGRDVFEAERTVQIVSELRAALADSEADTTDTQSTDQEVK